MGRFCGVAEGASSVVRCRPAALGGFAETQAELGGGFAVARQAKGAKVVEVALPSPFCDREDVVGVPQGAAACDRLHAVERQPRGAGIPTRAFQCGIDGDRIPLARLADAAVAGKDLVAEVAGVGAQAMLMHAEV